MRYRTFGRLGWQVSDIGYGMWGMGGWTGSEDERSLTSLDKAVALGCNFFDTAFAYGDGHSEQLLGETLKRHAGKKLYVATKVPPKNRVWPGKASTPVAQVFPYDYIIEMTERSRKNLGVSKIDLQQLHVWSDAWVEDDGWQRAARDLKKNGVIEGFGISINRWEAENVLKALDTDLVDAVQVVYNVFDQAPEDRLFPICQERKVAVIARVPFDEGSLTGTLKASDTWPKGDWRNLYFTPAHIAETLPRVRALQELVPEGRSLPDLALRFILHHAAVSTTIPGMRSLPHVESNIAASDAPPLDPNLVKALRAHRWERDWQVP
jgi:aryl-alcohol dehydrogenase-like predicted oxidoreductase